MLSPFHQEMLAFLEKNAELREEEEGFDPKLDLSVHRFHRSIEDARRSEEVISLEKILEDYRYLFDKRGPIHLETKWMNSVSAKEFADAGFSSYFPKFYRGLPRIYNRENPGISFIHKNFTHLADLKRLNIDRAVYSLYANEIPQKKKIGILAWVISDGFGDYVAAVEAASILDQNFPMQEIHLFIISRRGLPPGATPFPIHRMEEEEISFETRKLLREMDLILQINTYFPKTDKLLESIASISSEKPFPVVEHVGEYGYLASDWFHPKTGRYSMGLHALEKGIFVRKMNACSFAEIEKKELLHWLFGTQMPGPHEIERYREESRFYLAYLASPIGGAIYVHSLLKMLERDRKSIDLCCPDLGWFIRWIEERKKNGLFFLEETFGIKEIEVRAFDQSKKIQIGEQGKTLRILCPGVLSPSDMRRLFSLSEEWVAVRGNQSFTEAISAGKSFYYDGLSHSRYFIKDLVAMAENRIFSHRSALQAFRMMGQAFLWNMPEETGEWVDEMYFQQKEKMGWFQIALELGSSLQDPDAIAGFKKFSKIVHDEHAFNPFLCHLVQRGLFLATRSDLSAAEKAEMSLYLRGVISFSTLVKNIRIRMMRIG